jgi:hypothetical protein
MLGFINTTLLWALLAVALPLLIHLLTRRKLRLVTVSTIAFLKRLEKEKIRKLKLRQLLLLLLRMLIVALLVLAFARPTLRSEQAALARRAATTAVVILDNSLSMAAAPDGVSLLSLARQQAMRLAGLFNVGDEIYLITAATPAHLVTVMPFLSPEKFAEMAASVPQTWAETDLIGALSLAREKLENSRNVNRELYIFSDGRAALPMTTAHSEATVEVERTETIRGLRGYFLQFNKTASNNLLLRAATLSNQIFERGKVFEVVAAVANNGQRDSNNQLVHLFLNGKRVAQQTIDVPAGAERRVTFRAVPDTTGFIFGRLELEDDDLILDNVRVFVFFIPPQRRLLAVSREPKDLAYLRLAFNPSGPRRDMTNQPQITNNASNDWREIPAEDLGAERFENYDGIILANVPRLSEATASRLIDYLNNGGGVMIFLGSDVDLRNYNDLLLARLGAGGFGETIGQLNSGHPIASKQNVTTLGRIDFSHPVFTGIFEKSEKQPRIDSPLFRFAVQMRLSDGTLPIMEYANGYPFLVERRVGKGQLLMFTSAATEKWSDFAFKGLFAPLIHRCIAYITQRNDHLQESHWVGDKLVATLRTSAMALEMELPDGDRCNVSVSVIRQNYQMNFSKVDQIGHYRLWQTGIDSLSRNSTLLQAWAVNFNPQEMQQPPFASQTLEAASGAGSLILLSSDADLLTTVRKARHGSELWPYFLVAAISAMLIEMWLSRSARQPKVSVGKSMSQETALLSSP